MEISPVLIPLVLLGASFKFRGSLLFVIDSWRFFCYTREFATTDFHQYLIFSNYLKKILAGPDKGMFI
jgi:hypothetical protein